jgi:hypothetical protein
MTEANEPGAATEDGGRYRDLLLWAVNVLTDAARLSWTGTGPDGQPMTGAADWAEFVSLALAGAAANIGGIEAILAGRPGSWEADHLRSLLTSTVGYDGEYLLEHRTEPVVVTLFVDEILFDQGVWQSYDDALQELARRYEAIGRGAVTYDETLARLDAMTPEQNRQADEIAHLEQELERQRERDWAAYGQALKAHVEATAAQTSGLNVPVVVNLDLETFRAVHRETEDWGIAEQWSTAAISATPLPGANRSPLDRLRQAGVTARTRPHDGTQ